MVRSDRAGFYRHLDCRALLSEEDMNVRSVFRSKLLEKTGRYYGYRRVNGANCAAPLEDGESQASGHE